MLEIFLFLAVGLAVLIAGVLAFAASRLDTFHVARSIGIKAPPQAIFPLINDLKQFATWSPYERKDPDMHRAFSGPDSGKGQRYDWEGDSNVGKGWLLIADSAEPERVDIDLNMVKPMRATNRVTFTLVPKGEITTVTWELRGRAPLIARAMQLFVDMDRMCGNDFEIGLATLQSMTEGTTTAPAHANV